MNINSSITEVNQSDLFTISWSPGGSRDSLSHYIVQLDENPSVFVQNTSITLLTTVSPDRNHRLCLEAVDMCGQISEPLVKTIIGRKVNSLTNYSSQPSTTEVYTGGRY
jgi:hypothetical protein